MFGLALGRMGRVGALTDAQKIAALFANSEPGAWYDPADLSTLFQDSAFAVPVTAVEQPVGGMLDLSGRGNHASMATTTKRPIYSRRVNMLTKTEDFTNAAWVKNGVVNTSDATFAPDGIQSADKQSPANGVGVASGYSSQTISKPTLAIAYKAVVFAKRGEHDTFGLIVVSDSASNRAGVTVSLASGEITTPAAAFGGFSSVSAAVSDADNGWYLVELSFTTDALPSITLRTYGGFSGGGLGDGVAGIYLWGASLTPAADAHLPYQRVNTATDYDADPSKFPAYLRFEVDDALQTGNIDFTGTDKMTVWAGVTKLSDPGIICELGVFSNTGMYGTFSMQSQTGGYLYASRGTFGPNASLVTGYAAPNSSVLTGVSSIGDDYLSLNINGISAAQSTADQGSGNYGLHAVNIGARNGTSLYFNGRLYSLIVRGAQSSLSQIETTEAYIKQKMRLS